MFIFLFLSRYDHKTLCIKASSRTCGLTKTFVETHYDSVIFKEIFQI